MTHHAITVTPNRRLARFLKQRIDTSAQRLGAHTWPTPLILSWDDWITDLWDTFQFQTGDDQRLLSATQRLFLWEKIIRTQQPDDNYLSNPIALAEAAAQSLERLQYWAVPQERLAHTHRPDTQTFVNWLEHFQQTCHTQHWIDLSQATQQLATAFLQKKIRPPILLQLVGFDVTPPIIEQFCRTLTQVGTTISTQDFFVPEAKAYRAECAHESDELLQMVHFAKENLAAGKTAIAFVVPSLQQCRKKIARVFTDHELPFNLSASPSLFDYPIIYTACQLFTLAQPQIRLATVRYLLRSPFLKGAHVEMEQRHQLDRQLQSYANEYINKKRLIMLAETQRCLLFAETLRQQPTFTQRTSATRNDWETHWTTTLTHWGWPGERHLNSTEYQVVTRFEQLLKEYLTLETIIGHCDDQRAHQQLVTLLQQTPFQPQDLQSPIHILGLFEASGLFFDALWMMGLDENTWPQPIQPDPFIPFMIQKKYGLPRVDTTKEYAVATQITHRFAQSATQVVFSYAKEKNGIKQKSSALIRAFDILPNKSYITMTSNPISPIVLETLEDIYGLPLQKHEKTRGGSQLLRTQAHCAFQAYCTYRLQAEPSPSAVLGLSRRDRGIVVHATMKQLWDILQDQKTLLTYDQNNLQDLIEAQLTLALNPYVQQATHKKIEIMQLSSLLQMAFDYEKKRPPFRVLGHEIEQIFWLDEKPLKLRIDRIDVLEDENYCLIDYKTGHTSTNGWFDERLTEPQLPLYLLNTTKTISQMALFEIRPEGVHWQHYTQEAGDWSIQKQRWQMQLDQLVHAVKAGHAMIDPVDGEKTCQFCHLQTICRIHETP